MKRLAILLAAIWLAACTGQSTAGMVDKWKVDKLAVGQSTASQVSSQLGPPMNSSTLADGRQVMVYRTAWLETGATTFAGGTSSESHYGTATLTFDTSGVLQSVQQTREP